MRQHELKLALIAKQSAVSLLMGERVDVQDYLSIALKVAAIKEA
jgi:hypothetical protein